jgi:histidinol dehydrogenase
MNFIRYPQAAQWPQLLARPVMDLREIEERVAPILRQVREKGDDALRDFTLQFDKVQLDDLRVSPAERAEAETLVSPELKAAIGLAKSNIETFHRAQLAQPEPITTQPGVTCWRKSVGIEKVGLYIPGGSAPLFSTVLMLGVPARLAGCRQVVLCTPANRAGKVHPAILYAAAQVGITDIFKVGGAQAVAAMAYGTESIPRADKLFGPGNQYVTAAKQLVNKEGLAIDMPAGPSEVAVYADDSSNPVFVAADLLSQAEHGIPGAARGRSHAAPQRVRGRTPDPGRGPRRPTGRTGYQRRLGVPGPLHP